MHRNGGGVRFGNLYRHIVLRERNSNLSSHVNEALDSAKDVFLTSNYYEVAPQFKCLL